MLISEKKKREQIQVLCIDDLVPKIENAMDWNFIYESVEDRYCKDKGRPSIDPVTLIKIPMIQYPYGNASNHKEVFVDAIHVKACAK